MIEWALGASAVAAGILLVLWLRERSESKDLRTCCNVMGEMYERCVAENERLRNPPAQPLVQEQSARWLN